MAYARINEPEMDTANTTLKLPGYDLPLEFVPNNYFTTSIGFYNEPPIRALRELRYKPDFFLL